jgi:Guanine nucleotide exchange factor synembryn
LIQIEEAHYLRLVSILHDLLLCDTKTPERREDLQSHTINLLTNMPPSSFEELLSPVTEIGKPDNPEHEFNEMNMEVIDVMLQFLSKRLDSAKGNYLRETLAPVLTCLSEAARCNSTIRKFFRNKVLPPLRDVKSRPGGTRLDFL